MPANCIQWPSPAAIVGCLALSLALASVGCQGNRLGSPTAGQQMQQRFDQSEKRTQKDIETQHRRLGTAQSALHKDQ
jgi:hypothetical protein